MGPHLARDHLTRHHWLMDDGAQHHGGGRPRMITSSSTDHTMTSSSCSYTYLMEEEDHLVPKGYPCWMVKPIGDKGVNGP